MKRLLATLGALLLIGSSAGAVDSGFSINNGFAGATRPQYTSPVQAFAISSAVTLNHGLGSMPSEVRIVFKCTIANDGYSPGDQVVFYPDGNNGMHIQSTSTQVVIHTNSTPPVFVPKGGGVAAAITLADWTETVYANP